MNGTRILRICVSFILLGVLSALVLQLWKNTWVSEASESADEKLVEQSATPSSPVVIESLEPTVLLMGDSIAAGEGAGNYWPKAENYNEDCHRSNDGMLHSVVQNARVLNTACSRAKVPDFYPSADNPGQLAQMVLAPEAKAVIVTVGGNDIGFPELLNDCLVDANFDCSTSAQTVERTQQGLQKLSVSLEELFEDLLSATGTSESQVFILAYPDLLAGEGTCGRISAAERVYGITVIEELNGTLRDAATAVRMKHGTNRLEFLEATAKVIDGHGPCTEQSWVKPYGLVSLFSAMDDTQKGQQILHPNEQGYASIGDALKPHLENLISIPWNPLKESEQ